MGASSSRQSTPTSSTPIRSRALLLVPLRDACPEEHSTSTPRVIDPAAADSGPVTFDIRPFTHTARMLEMAESTVNGRATGPTSLRPPLHPTLHRDGHLAEHH